jgi:2-polyprenyl-3-methyl-5-hydroxy-6-metoxy-1,4-benzoquinol methylase
MDEDGERRRLSEIANDSWYARGAFGASARYNAEVFARYWRGDRCLELGPAEGLMTEQLAGAFSGLTLVDGSEQFCEALRRRFPTAEVVCALFEDYEPTHAFDTVIVGHVLEHVDDPNALLARAGAWVAPDGVLLACVPNGRSIHRQAAVQMGLLDGEYELNETDRHHGHRRVYSPESLRATVRAAGLRIEIFGGYWLKPVSNAQIDSDWSDHMLRAFMELGERYPDIAAEIYVVARAQ